VKPERSKGEFQRVWAVALDGRVTDGVRVVRTFCLVNSLCYLLMTFLVIDIIANMVSLITISSLANQLVIKGANSIQDENSLYHALSMVELLTGILLLVTTVFSFVPILILNIGIYRKNKA
jgi:hypothetical protein